jgi:aryl-alcohol dehydrogenase
VVEKVGKKVKRVRVNDHVLLSFASCGSCRGCRSKHPARCVKFDALNISWAREDGSPTLWDVRGKPLGGNLFGQSSLAYYSLTHERNAIVLRTPLKQLPLFAPLGCGIQAGAATVLNELKPKKEESLLILGCGAVGLAALMSAKMVHVATIIAADKVSSRLRLAKQLGAHQIINTQTVDLTQALRKIVGEVDHIVETTGSSIPTNQALECLSASGKASLLAISSDDAPIRQAKRGQTFIDSIAGDSNPQEFIPYLISCYKKGKFPFDRLIKFYPATQIRRAVKDCIKGVTIKPVLCF